MIYKMFYVANNTKECFPCLVQIYQTNFSLPVYTVFHYLCTIPFKTIISSRDGGMPFLFLTLFCWASCCERSCILIGKPQSTEFCTHLFDVLFEINRSRVWQLEISFVSLFIVHQRMHNSFHDKCTQILTCWKIQQTNLEE